MTSSTEEKQKVLQAEVRQQENIAAAERTKRERAEQDAKEKQAEVSRLEVEVAEAIRQKNAAAAEHTKRERAEQDAKEKQAEVSRLEVEIQKAGSRQVADARKKVRLCLGMAVLGATLAAGVWAFDSELVATILQVLSLGSSYGVLLCLGVRLVGAVVLVSSFFPAVHLLKPAYRIGALTAVVAIAVGGLDLIGPAMVASISGYLAIGAPIALALVIILEWSRVVGQDET